MNARPLRTVLYVDDEPDIRKIVQIALGLTTSFKVQAAQSGEEGLAMARALLPDLVLLDVMMPDLDGPGTLSRMRIDPMIASIPIIFMTAKAMSKEVALLHEMGAVGVIAKPFDPMLLGAQVLSLWNGRPADPSTPVKAADSPSLRREISQLGKRFLLRTRKETVRLRDLVEVIQTADATEMEELENLAHRIHGSGSTFGFGAVSECAGEIEHLVRGLRKGGPRPGGAVDFQICQRLTECARRLTQEVEAAAA
jgi:CheY-like chemotaxis protein